VNNPTLLLPGLRRLAALGALTLATGAFGAITLPNGQGEISVSASASAQYDSNIYASRERKGDYLATNTLELGYSRTALYSLDTLASVRAGWFNAYSENNYADPLLRARLSTSSGANSLSVEASTVRSHTANSLLGERTDQWRDSFALTWRRPLWKRYTLAFNAGYSAQRYETEGLDDLRARNARLDLFRALTPKLSAFAGYWINEDHTAPGGESLDQSLTCGLSQQILPKVRGFIRIGRTTRENDRTRLRYVGLTTSVDLTWTPSTRFSLTGSADQGTSTYARGGSLENKSLSLSARLRATATLSLSASATAGQTRFLDLLGRRDRFVTGSTAVHYQLTPRLSCSASFERTDNRSSLEATADYQRNLYSGTLSFTW